MLSSVEIGRNLVRLGDLDFIHDLFPHHFVKNSVNIVINSVNSYLTYVTPDRLFCIGHFCGKRLSVSLKSKNLHRNYP